MICYSTPWESLISLSFVLLELFSIRSGLQRSWCRYTHERRVELFLRSCWTWLPGIDFVCQLLVNSVNTFTVLSMAIEKLWTWVIQWFIANRKRQVLVHHRKPKASLTYTLTVGQLAWICLVFMTFWYLLFSINPPLKKGSYLIFRVENKWKSKYRYENIQMLIDAWGKATQLEWLTSQRWTEAYQNISQ